MVDYDQYELGDVTLSVPKEPDKHKFFLSVGVAGLYISHYDISDIIELLTAFIEDLEDPEEDDDDSEV